MNKQIRYTDIPIGGEPIGELKIITDSLPSPKELKFKSANTKVTISLSSESVAYFKAVAKANQMQYQKMIRQLLDVYVTREKARTESDSEHHEAYKLRDGVSPPGRPKAATPRSTSCLYNDEEISVDKALSIRGDSRSPLPEGAFKCVECRKPVRPHKGGRHGAAHFEHYSGNSDCSLSDSVAD